ncbi:MAG: hypothetical protein WA628_22330 [Terriglobales bacterium]
MVVKWRYYANYGKPVDRPLTCVSATKRISRKGNMLSQFALAVLLSGSALAQTHAPVEPHLQQLEQLDEIRGRRCEVPEGFACGILFDLDLPESGNMNLSVVGGVVHQISVILNGTMYTVVYDPPLKRDDKFSSLRRYGRIPARIDGDHLTIQWPDKTKAKGRIVRREKIEPERPWPA